MHPEDEHFIISTDTDYNQLITEKVKQYNGVTGELATLQGYFKENGRPVLDKEKKPKLLEDPEYLLFKKCKLLYKLYRNLATNFNNRYTSK